MIQLNQLNVKLSLYILLPLNSLIIKHDCDTSYNKVRGAKIIKEFIKLDNNFKTALDYFDKDNCGESLKIKTDYGKDILMLLKF